MKKFRRKIIGRSYAARVEAIMAEYDKWARSGLSNREILRRYISPRWHIAESTFYNMVKASSRVSVQRQIEELQLQIFPDPATVPGASAPGLPSGNTVPGGSPAGPPTDNN